MKASTSAPLVVLAAAVASVVILDIGIRQVSPVPRLREARDGILQLQQQNPETIVVGSSHARTFHTLGEVLAAESPDRPPLVAVPLEAGKLTGYAWLTTHRVFPLLDERDAAGRRRRDRVRRVIVLTEWWDSCRPGAGEDGWNIPARGWNVSDYLADVRANGFTDYNRTFLREWARGWFRGSVVVQRRGTGRILLDAARALDGRESIHTQAGYAASVERWRRTVERGATCIGDGTQMAALVQVLDGVRARGLESIVILFPRKPDTITAKAESVTLQPFAEMVRTTAGAYDARVIDLTTRSPLTSQDFMDDFDHVTVRGNQKFARWALSNELAFLKQPPVRAASTLTRAGSAAVR